MGHASSALALRAGGRRDGVSRLLKGGQVGADREIGRLQQSQEKQHTDTLQELLLVGRSLELSAMHKASAVGVK